MLVALERHQRIIRVQVELTQHLAWLQLLLLAVVQAMETAKALVYRAVLVAVALVVLAALVHQDREMLVEAGQAVRLTMVVVAVAVLLLSVQTEHQLLLVMVAQELHPQFLAHLLPTQGAAVAEPIKVELLVLVAQAAVEAVELAEQTTTELLELLTRAAVAVEALFKPTYLTWLVEQVALAL